jgi:hypothetical protein
MLFNNAVRIALAGMLLVGAFLAGARAADPEDAKAMAERAVILVKAEGENAFPKLSDPSGEYVKGEIYVTVLDKQGVVRANINPKAIGINMWEATDPDGVKFTQLSWQATESSETAWISYKYTNPVSKKIEAKKAWVHRVGNYVVMSGVYVSK